MTFNCRLQKFFVKDLTPDTLYPNILEIGTDENPFFDLKVEQFKSDGMTRRLSRRSTEPLDYYARLHIGQLQVAFINKFFWEITRFFEPLKSPELSDVAYRTKESVSKQMMEITPATVRVALVVKAHIPTVVVPQHSQSRDLFFVKFGNLEVWNQFERKEVRDSGMSQEWNHFSAKLTSMQISKGKLLEDNATFVVLHHLVEPVNFTASFSLALAPFVADIVYDVSGELNLVKVNMLETDMKLVMDIMKQNFGEGAPSAKPDLAKPSSMKPTSTMDSSVTVIQHDLDTPTTPEVMPGTPYNAVVTLQGLVLCLYEETNGTTSSIEKNFLSRFEVGKIKARANSHKEGENKLDFNLSFHTMSIDDMRPNNTRAVRNVFYCTREEVVTDDDHKPLPMISVIYKTAHDGSQEADIRMEKVTLNLNVPFLLRLQEFYAVSMGTTSDLPPPPLPGDLDTDGSHVDSPDLPAPVTPLKVFCTIKEPEIVLFADPSLEDSRIVVLKADIEVDMVNNEKTQKLVSKVKDLKMYSAQYSTQHAVSSWVIQPCDLTFERTYNILENHVDMSAHITELILCTSPSVLHFAFDVLALMGGKDSETPEDQATTSQTEDYRNLWGVKATSAEKWLNKIDNSGNSSMNPLIPQMSPSESLHLEIEQIHAYFQVRNLDHQVNLLHIRSSLDCKLHDWNKQFHMNAEMKLQVDYFNEKLSVWEPLVEPVSEKEGIYRPWEVVIKVIRGRSYPMTFNYVQEGFNMEECLRNDVQQLLHNSRRRSSSSESETDESTEMTVLRPKLPRKRSRIASDKSYVSYLYETCLMEADVDL
ncbi:vacuolar protein sorting-associated protein 13C-like [Pecten maximus]|uniref:vacuolar protein sorting-associated protein 13C-like n=1 Tax=Pecten maximus TaxID=6579 RepID=UPI001457F392|nr:vacuolar protein sorting-associated protein 13C-like [Pecten maximus]